MDTEQGETGLPWTRAEVEATVATYFQMLRMQELGQKANKAEHNRRLLESLPARSIQAVEYWSAPIRRGDPGYSSKLDRDGDGIVSEQGRDSLHPPRVRMRLPGLGWLRARSDSVAAVHSKLGCELVWTDTSATRLPVLPLARP